jgi:peroxiredoxin
MSVYDRDCRGDEKTPPPRKPRVGWNAKEAEMHRWLSRGLLAAAALGLAGYLATPDADAGAEPPAAAVSAARTVDTAIELIDVASGKRAPLRSLAGAKATLVFFSSNECPVALAYEQDMAATWEALRGRGVQLVAVSASRSARDAINEHRAAAKLPYPLYQDVGGKLASALDATRTSEVALVAPDGTIAYQGRIDDRVTPSVRRPRATTHELADAVDAMLAGRPVAAARTQAAGCVIARVKPAERAAKVTYADVAPILDRYCAACHRPGEAGPMSLLTYDQTAEWADTIVEVLRDNRMPPSKLSPPDPRYGEFLTTAEPTAAEIDRLAAWAAAGAPRGAGARSAPRVAEIGGWAIGKPDMVLTMPTAYAVPASGVVEYQYYDLLQYTGDERWIEAIEIRPSVRSVVHHANVYMSSSELGTGGFDSGERWASFAPGRPPVTFPAGVARRLPRGGKLRLEVHYTPDGVAHEDRTVIGLRFARTPPRREARSIPLGSLNFTIPPRAPNHEVIASYTMKGNGKIASFTPHMHDRGKDFRYEATLPDGTTRTLLSVPRYDFKWQFVYFPREMIALPKGTVLKAIAHYDNSPGNPRNPDPDKAVTFGLQTFEEMMFGFVDMVYDEDVDSPALKALRDADRATVPQDLGFASWIELGVWAKARKQARAAK